MGTIVRIEIVGPHASGAARAARDEAIARAFDWFTDVEARCSRFDPASELSRLVSQPGVAVEVSELLFRAVEFACAFADETGGAFDPAVGRVMEQRGFDAHYRTGERVSTSDAASDASWRDVEFDAARRTIRMARPLALDLGAVAKGLAIDLAARELAPFTNFAIDAGGDVYMGGTGPGGRGWTVGIAHPREPGGLIGTLRVSDRAVCTSGDYERRAADGAGHIVDPRAQAAVRAVASVTAVAPGAMLADAATTAAFVLGPAAGLALFDRLGIDGLIVDQELRTFSTPRMADALLPHA
jgi:thiamine biosynthesis lipoprotein